MARFINKIDLNGDNKFTGEDLDISWAALQVQALQEAGDTTINSSNFLTKVKEQYIINKTAGIAEASDLEPKKLPASFEFASATGDSNIKFERLWTMNDMYDGTTLSSRPTTLLESMTGERTGTVAHAVWVKKDVVDPTFLLTLTDHGFISFDDKGAIRNDESWTIYLAGRLQWNYYSSAGTNLIEKGGVKLVVFPDKLALISSFNDIGYFRYPGGSKGVDSAQTFRDKFTEFYIVKDGIEINIYINGQRCDKEAEASLPRLISNSDSRDQPIKVTGKSFKNVTKFAILDNTFKDFDVLNVNGDYIGEPYQWGMKSDLNMENSFFAFRQYLSDRYGNYFKIDTDDPSGVHYGGSAGAQMRWENLPQSIGNANGFDDTNRTKCYNLEWPYLSNKNWRKKPEYFEIPNVNFESNFTLSFWISTTRRSENFVSIISDATGEAIHGGFTADRGSFGFQHNGRSGWDNYSNKTSTGSHKPHENWTHITLVKNNNMIGTWVNGFINKWMALRLSDQYIEDFGTATIKFTGRKNHKTYLADLRYLPYALSHVPVENYGIMSTYNFIDKLQERENS